MCAKWSGVLPIIVFVQQGVGRAFIRAAPGGTAEAEVRWQPHSKCSDHRAQGDRSQQVVEHCCELVSYQTNSIGRAVSCHAGALGFTLES